MAPRTRSTHLIVSNSEYERLTDLANASIERLPEVDVILLAQFSMARARDAVSALRPGTNVLTSPHAAVEQLRQRLAGG